jgi:hypothetical protein
MVMPGFPGNGPKGRKRRVRLYWEKELFSGKRMLGEPGDLDYFSSNNEGQQEGSSPEAQGTRITSQATAQHRGWRLQWWGFALQPRVQQNDNCCQLPFISRRRSDHSFPAVLMQQRTDQIALHL